MGEERGGIRERREEGAAGYECMVGLKGRDSKQQLACLSMPKGKDTGRYIDSNSCSELLVFPVLYTAQVLGCPYKLLANRLNQKYLILSP